MALYLFYNHSRFPRQLKIVNYLNLFIPKDMSHLVLRYSKFKKICSKSREICPENIQIILNKVYDLRAYILAILSFSYIDYIIDDTLESLYEHILKTESLKYLRFRSRFCQSPYGVFWISTQTRQTIFSKKK